MKRLPGVFSPRAALAIGAAMVLSCAACSLFRGGPTPEESAMVAAYDFRWLAASNYAQALSTYAEPALIKRFPAINETVWPATDPRVGWAYFFNTSVMFAGGYVNNIMTVAFYHPWSDAMLVTAWWAPKGAAPRLVDAEVLMGDFVRRSGQPPFSPERPWMRQDQYRPVAVGLSTAETARSFEYFFKNVQQGPAGWRSVLPGLTDAQTIAANNHGAGLMLMANLAELSGIIDPLDDAGKSLRKKFGAVVQTSLSGDLRELASAPLTTDETRTALGYFKPLDLNRFQLAAFIGGTKKSLIMLTRPDHPGVFLSILFKNDRGRWSIERADLLSFQKFYDLGPMQGGK